MVQLWDWTPRHTHTRLLHDVAAKPVVLSAPVNDQVLIYTPESRETSVGECFAQRNCDSVASTRIKPSTLITEYRIPDVITNALPSAPPSLPRTPALRTLNLESPPLVRYGTLMITVSTIWTNTLPCFRSLF